MLRLFKCLEEPVLIGTHWVLLGPNQTRCGRGSPDDRRFPGDDAAWRFVRLIPDEAF